MTEQLSYWIAYTALSGCILLSGAALLLLLASRQPVRRLRLIQLTLLGCLAAPLLNQLPGVARVSLGWFSQPEDATAAVASVRIADSRNPKETVRVNANTDQVAPRPGQFAANNEVEVVPAPRTEPVGDTSTDAAEQEVATLVVVEAPAVVQSRMTEWNVADWLVAAYLVAVGGQVFWWVFGFALLTRLKLSTRAVPDATLEVFREIAGPECDRVQLRSSDRVVAPIAYGWLRPVIVLPTELCGGDDTPELRYALAHEWSHVSRRDVRDLYLATLVQFLFFYQPLFWWIRRQLLLCQDYLADAYAADHADQSEDYASYLVLLARRRMAAPLSVSLGFANRSSQLSRRITMLVKTGSPIERRCSWIWNATVTLVAVGFICGVSAISLEANTQAQAAEKVNESKTDKSDEAKVAASKDKQASTPKPKEPAERNGKEVIYNGKITDKASGAPVVDAKVEIWLTLSSDPKTGGRRDLRNFTLQTDKDGKFTFKIKPEEDAERTLYVEVAASHPGYGAKSRGGYGHRMLVKNLEKGDPPWFSNLQLWPGKPIKGVVKTPDGKPAEGVDILAYVKHSKAERFSFGGWIRAKTDKDGRFQITAATPGEGVLWLTPPSHVPTAHFVTKEKRGDYGEFILQPGAKVKGKLLSAKGEPVSGWTLRCRRRNDGVEEVDQFLGQNAVANGIGRSGKTNKKGEFSFADLPPGEYEIRIGREYNQSRRKPAPHVFLYESLTIKAGEPVEPLEIRAVPHVEIHVQYVDSKGKPCGGHQQSLFGRFEGGRFFHTRSNAPKPSDGKLVFKVPHGLQKVQLDFSTNEHSSLQWRMSPDGPLKSARRIELGTVEDDITGIQIVRYTAPLLFVKIVDESGKLIKDAKPKALFEEGKSPKSPGSRFINGVQGDVSFEQQADGRWRSSSLLPDHKLTVSAQQEGLVTKEQVVSLKEASEKELVFVMTPQAEDK